ncbi:hypothetical protein BN2497_12471 [Janthinobacterium sp. CG23_2]|nr:hypothetical protein BN2497_12471 [Janthinobacterium sp. CG23_2]CUU32633.1 hypothetical protein BN3177_12471 [Janthinobacterium sp. CG23_2]
MFNANTTKQFYKEKYIYLYQYDGGFGKVLLYHARLFLTL